MALPRLQVILDVEASRAAGWSLADLTDAFLDGGATWMQVRGGGTPSGPLLDICDDVVGRAHARGALVIVNDRPDLARLSGADGAHVGQTDLPPAAARHILGPDAILGWSTHTVTQIDAAAAEPLTYVAVGPVFGTRTKDTGYTAVGLDLVSEAARRAGARPVVAIGGITLESAPAVIAAGAAAVAAISDLLAGGRPADRVAAYLRALA